MSNEEMKLLFEHNEDAAEWLKNFSSKHNITKDEASKTMIAKIMCDYVKSLER